MVAERLRAPEIVRAKPEASNPEMFGRGWEQRMRGLVTLERVRGVWRRRERVVCFARSDEGGGDEADGSGGGDGKDERGSCNLFGEKEVRGVRVEALDVGGGNVDGSAEGDESSTDGALVAAW